MNPLSVDRINAHAPYSVTLTSKGYFLFNTDQDVTYAISFTEEFEIGGCMGYQFSIRNANNHHGSFDKKIRETIVGILEEFFRTNINVLLYICDTSDQREAARNRLFIHWFKQFADPSTYTFCSSEAIVEGEGFYTAMIVENRNPSLQAIKEEYELMVREMSK